MVNLSLSAVWNPRGEVPAWTSAPEVADPEGGGHVDSDAAEDADLDAMDESTLSGVVLREVRQHHRVYGQSDTLLPIPAKLFCTAP